MAQQPKRLSPHLSLEHLIGAELRRWRTQQGLSQGRLAATVHTSADLIARIERGERRLLEPLASQFDETLGTSGGLAELVASRVGKPGAEQRPILHDPVRALGQLLASSERSDAEDLLDRAVMRMRAYPNFAPADLWLSTQQDLAQAESLLRRSVPFKTHRALLHTVAILAGTAGHLLFDLADRANGTRFLELSRDAGLELEEPELVAWSMVMAAIDPLTEGRSSEATSCLTQAVELLQPQGNKRRLAWAYAMLAKAQAWSMDEASALRSLDRARDALDAAENPVHLDFFDLPRLDGIEGSSLLRLRNAHAARESIEAAIAKRPVHDVKGRAHLTLDLAECYIIERDVASAASQIVAAVNAAEAQLVAPIRRRVLDLQQKLRSWKDSREVQQLDDRLISLARPAEGLYDALAGTR